MTVRTEQSKSFKSVQSSQKWLRYWILVGLIFLTCWLRLWRLDVTPPGLWFDEAYNGMDALWLADNEGWPVFLLGNNGREALYYYLLRLSIAFLGETIYAIRFVSALLGILTVPLMYRWSLLVFQYHPNGSWLALLSTTGLSTSFWFLVMNRAGYRANLLPLFLIIISYYFWQGWKTDRVFSYVMAGFMLGLAQYTYLSARLIPLIFLLFVGLQTFFLWGQKSTKLWHAWRGILIMAGTSGVIAAPLLLFFANMPTAFWGRVNDVAISVSDFGTVISHLWQAILVFWDGQDPNWRHHLLGRPGLNWFTIGGGLMGSVTALIRHRRPIYLFLLISLFVMWFPAPLSEPAFHTLRLSGILPTVYILMALGFASGIAGLTRLRWQTWPLFFFVLYLPLNSGLTIYDYFYRWANRIEVYEAYDTPVVELATQIVAQVSNKPVVIPYYLYTHASMRYLLNQHFVETVLLPKQTAADLQSLERINLIIPEYPANDGKPPAYVLLTNGAAYVSAVNRDWFLGKLITNQGSELKGYRNNIIAHQYTLDFNLVASLFPQQIPQKKIYAAWADNLVLTGFEFNPDRIESSQSSELYLFWKILGHTALNEKMFLQWFDSQNRPVGQLEVPAISRKMYRWRKQGLILEQHPVRFQTKLDAGLYFARIGFFDPITGERLILNNAKNQPDGDQFIVGPLYVSNDNHNPILPECSTSVSFSDSFKLLGYSLHPSNHQIHIELFWQTYKIVDVNYTVSIQLLNIQDEVVAQTDAQPLASIYPTSRWQIDDIVAEKFTLPISLNKLNSSQKLVTSMYDLSTGQRLLARNKAGELLPDSLVELPVVCGRER